MTTFPSFEEIHDNFTLLPNRLLDCLIDERLDTYDRNILLFIARQTYGWRCAFDHLTMGDFAKTGISKTKAMDSLKKLEQLDYILVSRIVDAKKQQHKIYFINTEEAHRIIAFCKSGEMSYKELARYRQLQIAAKKDPRSCGDRPQYAENTPPVRVANPPRSCGEPLLKETLKANFKAKQQSIPQTPLPGSDVHEAVGPAAPDAAFLKTAWEPEPEWETEGQDELLTDDDWQDSESEATPKPEPTKIPLLANPPDAPEPPSSEPPPLDDGKALFNELIAAQVEPDYAFTLSRQFPDECRRQLDYLPYRATVTRPGAYLAAAIRGSYAPPADYKPTAPAEDLQKQAAVAEVLARVKPGQMLKNSKGELLEVLTVRPTGDIEAKNLTHRVRVNFPPEVALKLQEAA